jgi:hypothetical protein
MKMTLRGTIRGFAAPFGLAVMATGAATAGAATPTPFPVYDSGSALVTAHPVSPGERLVIAGRPVTLGSVTHPGPAYIAHVLGVLPPAWAGKTLPAVPEL